MKKTFSPKLSEIENRWYVMDAEGIPLGRLATEVARLLMGKHKPTWAPHIDTGDFVIVLNAEKTVLTGQKEHKKIYYRHTTRPGSMKEETAAELRQRRPTQLVEKAVKGMLPKSILGRQLFRKLKVYTGTDHPHGAQQPTPFTLS